MAQVDESFFAEPAVEDPTFAKGNEDLWAWLHRSTVPKAIESRRFLNSNLSKLTPAYCRSLYSRLRHSWSAAFFELIVARTLQVVGADLEIEPSPDGLHRPDFKAVFPAGSLIVEATAPIFKADVQQEMGQKDALVSLIESLAPSGWGVFVHELPSLGPADSKREFKRVATKLLDVPSPQDDQWLRITGAVGEEVIDVTLIPKGHMETTVVGGPVQTFWGDGVEIVKKAVRRKRQQVRGSGCPVILAIRGSEMFCSMDDFERALFGHERGYADWSGHIYKSEFIADGILNPRGDEPPTYAGVLAYRDVGFYCSYEPIFFLHPRFRGEIPNEFRKFEWRTMESGRGISVIPAEDREVLQRLGPVRV